MKTLIAGVPSVIWLGVIMALTTFTNDYLSAYPWATYVLAILGAAGVALKTYIERREAPPTPAPTGGGVAQAAPAPRRSFWVQWLVGRLS